MGGLPRVKVINPGDSWRGTKCYINNQKIEHVSALDFRVAVDEVPTFTFETNGLPEIDMPGDVQFSFTPQTVTEAVNVLRNELLKHSDVYKSFLDSIQSAINELPEETKTWSDGLAEAILKRIIGEE